MGYLLLFLDIQSSQILLCSLKDEFELSSFTFVRIDDKNLAKLEHGIIECALDDELLRPRMKLTDLLRPGFTNALFLCRFHGHFFFPLRPFLFEPLTELHLDSLTSF